MCAGRPRTGAALPDGRPEASGRSWLGDLVAPSPLSPPSRSGHLVPGPAISDAEAEISPFDFTNEQTDATGLVYLRARYLAPREGRFTGRDPWQNPTQPMDYNGWLYAYANPINRTDPSGLLPLPLLNVREAISAARFFYSTKGVWDCDRVPDDHAQLNSDTVTDLWFDYLCERGPESRVFAGDTLLSRSMATSREVHEVRQEYYRQGAETVFGFERQFNIPEFASASLDWWYQVLSSGRVVPISVTHFVGSFDYYSVSRANGQVRFFISNRTDRSSGTHVPGRFSPRYTEYLERLVDANPDIGSEPALLYVLRNPVISVLAPKTRAETVDRAFPFEGGGNMWQVFTWGEPYLGCGEWQRPWPLPILNLEITQ